MLQLLIVSWVVLIVNKLNRSIMQKVEKPIVGVLGPTQSPCGGLKQ